MTLDAERPQPSTACVRWRTTSSSSIAPSDVLVSVNVKADARPPGGESVGQDGTYTDRRAPSFPSKCKSNKRTTRDVSLFVPFRSSPSSRPTKRRHFVNGTSSSSAASLCALRRQSSTSLDVGVQQQQQQQQRRRRRWQCALPPLLSEHDVAEEHLHHTEAKLNALEQDDWSNERSVVSILNALLSNLNETAAMASDDAELTPLQRELCQSISTTKAELKQLLTNLFSHDTQLIEQSLLLLS